MHAYALAGLKKCGCHSECDSILVFVLKGNLSCCNIETWIKLERQIHKNPRLRGMNHFDHAYVEPMKLDLLSDLH